MEVARLLNWRTPRLAETTGKAGPGATRRGQAREWRASTVTSTPSQGHCRGSKMVTQKWKEGELCLHRTAVKSLSPPGCKLLVYNHLSHSPEEIPVSLASCTLHAVEFFKVTDPKSQPIFSAYIATFSWIHAITGHPLDSPNAFLFSLSSSNFILWRPLPT